MMQALFWVFFVVVVIDHKGLFNHFAVDFGYFWAAAQAFQNDGPTSVYELSELRSHIEPLLAYYGTENEHAKIGMVVYPPVYILLMLPFTVPSSPIVGFLLWTVLNVILTGFVAVRLSERVHVSRVALLACTFMFFPIARSLFVGQPGGLILLALWKGIDAIERGQHLRSGLWLGVLLIKPNYVGLILIWLLITKRWRVLVGVSAVAAGLVASTVAILGRSGTLKYFSTATAFGTDIGERLPGAAADMMPSWRGFIANVPWSLSEFTSLTILMILSGMSLAALTLVFRYEIQVSENVLPLVVLGTVVVTVIANPIAHIHAVVMALVPGVLVAAGVNSIAIQVKRAYLVSLFVLPSVGLVSMAYTGWITWISMSLFGILMIVLVCILHHCRYSELDAHGIFLPSSRHL